MYFFFAWNHLPILTSTQWLFSLNSLYQQNPTGLYFSYSISALFHSIWKTSVLKSAFTCASLVTLSYRLRQKLSLEQSMWGKKLLSSTFSITKQENRMISKDGIFSVHSSSSATSEALDHTEVDVKNSKISPLYLLPCFLPSVHNSSLPQCGIIPHKDLPCSLCPGLFLSLFTPQASLEWNDAL